MMPYMVARDPYDSNSVWNLLDAAMDSSAPLFTIKEFSNVLRALNEEDQKMFTFAMTRVLSVGRFLVEARCEGLFKSLREVYEALQDMDVKRNQLKRQRNEARRYMETQETISSRRKPNSGCSRINTQTSARRFNVTRFKPESSFRR